MTSRHSRRRFLALSALGPVALALQGCLGRDGSASTPEPSPTVTIREATPTPPPTATVTATVAAPTATESPTPEPTPAGPDLHGFTVPVAGACIPDGDQLMPNAPRPYRRGVHEGVDFYNGLACVPIGLGTPVIAMQAGTVARADLDYVELTAEDVVRLDAITQELGSTDPETLDTYRGRQVWIDHGEGIVTRYCHLSEIDESIVEGAVVAAGDPVGAIGESGTPESVTDPGTELHLHAEVRIGDSFLGADLPPDEVRRLYVRLFEA